MLVDECPKSSTNFLKLCKAKYYNFSPVSTILQNKICYTGSRIQGESSESNYDTCAWGLAANRKEYFVPEMQTATDIEENSSRSFKYVGTVAWETAPSKGQFGFRHEDLISDSKFCISLKDNTKGQNDIYETEMAIFGHVVEGLETLSKINEAILNIDNTPVKPIMILHAHILEDPFPDIKGLELPVNSPEPNKKQLELIKELNEATEKSNREKMDEEEEEERRRNKEAESNALTLEMVGDLPFAEVLPEENILFVCKLNPITTDEDLELIFSRFGPIRSCEIVRDSATGDSLQYAFIEYENKSDCERAYFKMDGVLIDDRRIHVDFSQSVSKIAKSWRDQTNKKRKQVHGEKFQERRRNDERSDRDNKRSRNETQGRYYKDRRRHDDDYDYDRRRHRDDMYERRKRSPDDHERRRERRRERSPDDRRRDKRRHSPEDRRRDRRERRERSPEYYGRRRDR